MAYPRVTIVILNWNGWQDTIECLESLYRIDYVNYNIILLDNGSIDCSIESIRNYLNSKLRSLSIVEYGGEFHRFLSDSIASSHQDEHPVLIKCEKNYGFAEGNNIAIEFALNAMNPEYILLLNNDTVVDRKFLSELIKTAEKDDNFGLVGPKIYYYDFKGRKDIISMAGAKIDMIKGQTIHIGAREKDRGQYDQPLEADFLEGSCLLIRSSVLKEVGLLNPNYFAYWEEAELCRRASEAGYSLQYMPRSKIWHKISRTSNTIAKTYYQTRNRLWFMKQHATKVQLSLFLTYFLLYQFWLIGLVFIHKKNIVDLKYFLKGVAHGLLLDGSA